MTPWHRNEYILKGVFLGLWVFIALQIPADRAAAWIDIAWVLGWVGTGLAAGLVLGTALQVSRGLRPWQNWFAFPILVLLESPTFIYAGITLGLAGAVLTGREFAEPWATQIAGWFGLTFDDIRHLQSAKLADDDPKKGKLPGDWLGFCAVGGALLGLALYRFRQVEDRTWRFMMGLGVAILMVYLASEYVARVPGLDDPNRRFNLGLYILLGLPFFYLLTFCGEAEESEAEIMTLCAALGVALHLMNLQGTLLPSMGAALTFLLPVTLYFVYATRVLPELRVFKHVLRGFSYMNLGQLRNAIYFFRRALELDPNSALAAQGMQTLHNNLTLAKIDNDPELINALDFSLCLGRASALLMSKPTPADRAEAGRFLDLVEKKKPAYLARVDYLRVVSFLHAKDFDAAANTLSRLLDPTTPGYHAGVRKNVLYDAWDFALRYHPELKARLGWAELNKPGRRVEAIGAVERKLAAEPNDPVAKEYRAILYNQIEEGEFTAAIAPDGTPPKDFAYEYVEQLGMALVDDADPERRERGMGYLRMAGRGLRERAPGIFTKLAQVHEKHGDAENTCRALERAKKVAQGVGPRNLPRDQRGLYLDALRKLADLAAQRGELDTAIEELRRYLEDGGPAALEAYRKLAELNAKNGDALNAVLMVETGLTYSSLDTDLLKKKDSYYYSVEPERLEKVKDKVVKWFDVGYCVKKAMAVLNAKDGGVELLDWAAHLARLATIVKPASNGVRLVEARVLMRRGERDAGIKILEDIREGEKGSGDEQDAWYSTTKLLGQLYLDEFERPDLALKCYLDYKEYHKSGADTLYQIARCYEKMGDHPNAIKFYNTVTAYEGHSLYYDAKDALKRLGAKG